MYTIAVIGCGRIADGAHLPALQGMDDVRIKYGCDLILSKAQAAQKKFPKIENVTTDYHEVLSDPEVSAVWVLTPNYAHYSVTMDALKAGKHVFCEKPITVNYALSCEMAAEAEKQGKMLNIGVCNRYHESVIRLHDMVARGDFGNVYHVVTSFRANRSIPGLGGAFTTKAQSGGGVLIDWGIHYLDLILYILGGAKVKTASAKTFNEMAKDMKSYKYTSMWAEDTADVVNGTNDVDDFVSGFVRTDKATISLNGAWAQNIAKSETYVDILGDKAGARMDYLGQFHFFNGADLTETDSNHDIPNMYAEEDKAFLRSTVDGVKTKAHIDEILESMKLLDALYRSAAEGKEVNA